MTKIDPSGFCVYTHSKDGKLFYVGKGKASRPFEFGKHHRNAIWHSIVGASPDPIEVQVVRWFGTDEEASEFETSEIKRLLPQANIIGNSVNFKSPDNRSRESDRQAMTVRIPDLLRVKIDAYVERRKVEFSRYCLNDFFAEAARNLLDGPPPTQMVTTGWSTPMDIRTGKKLTAAQLASRIPGLSLGVGAPAEPLFSDAPADDVVSWRLRLDKARRIWGDDPSAGAEEYATLMLGGEQPPGKFQRWHSDQRTFNALVDWLDSNRQIEG